MSVYEKSDMSWSYMKLWGLESFSLTLFNLKLYFPFSEGAGYYIFL